MTYYYRFGSIGLAVQGVNVPGDPAGNVSEVPEQQQRRSHIVQRDFFSDFIRNVGKGMLYRVSHRISF
jgi:hypothetical protein